VNLDVRNKKKVLSTIPMLAQIFLKPIIAKGTMLSGTKIKITPVSKGSLIEAKKMATLAPIKTRIFPIRNLPILISHNEIIGAINITE
jgi:hypothetical protein